MTHPPGKTLTERLNEFERLHSASSFGLTDEETADLLALARDYEKRVKEQQALLVEAGELLWRGKFIALDAVAVSAWREKLTEEPKHE